MIGNVPEMDYREAERIALKLTYRQYNRKRMPVAIDLGDLEQAVRIGVYKSALTWDPLYGLPFSTYASGAAYNHAKRCYEKSFRVGAHRSRNDYFGAFAQETSFGDMPSPNGKDRWEETLPAPVEFVDDDELPLLESLCESAMRALTERERSAVDLHIYRGMTFAEIGEAWGVSASKGWQVYDRAVKKMRGAFSAPLAFAAIAVVAGCAEQVAEKEWLSRKEVAEELGIHPITAGELLQSGAMNGWKVGREWRTKRTEVARYKSAQQRQGAA